MANFGWHPTGNSARTFDRMTPIWQTDSLDELESLIWSHLGRSVVDAVQPWSLPTVGTCRGPEPDLRTMVLREVDRTWRRLVAYSDARADKVDQVRAAPATAWHFYDPRSRVQLRARGLSAVEHQTDFARRVWEMVPEANRANYRTMGVPGTVIPNPAEGHIFAPGGAENFALIVTTVSRLDWLWLAPSGHRRAVFEWSGGRWQGQWAIP